MELVVYFRDGSSEKCIPQLITPDFIPNENGGKVLHRKVGDQRHLLEYVDKNLECFFRNTGKVELWDAQKMGRYALLSCSSPE